MTNTALYYTIEPYTDDGEQHTEHGEPRWAVLRHRDIEVEGWHELMPETVINTETILECVVDTENEARALVDHMEWQAAIYEMGCVCPALLGEDCPLTAEECAARRKGVEQPEITEE